MSGGSFLSVGIDRGSAILFHPRTRDRDDVKALQDKNGVIFLDRTDHITPEYYASKSGASYWNAESLKAAREVCKDDDQRRAGYLKAIPFKSLVDVGCGSGGLLAACQSFHGGGELWGVELQDEPRNELAREFKMCSSVNELPSATFDLVGMFHVLEHLTDPVATFAEIRRAMKPGGTIVVEVPHARDVLFKLEAFRDFSLWSEHLVLHTKESLAATLEHVGFSDIYIKGIQRYSLANHIGWLLDSKPGGQKRYTIASEDYEKHLVETDQTDTLLATAVMK